MSVWIAQCLCGPNRHCIFATAGECENEDDARSMIPALREAIKRLCRPGNYNPWCAICGAPITKWRYEVAKTKFATLEEGGPELTKMQASNLLANALFGTHGPNPPTKQ